MKQALICIFALVLTAGVVWAEALATETEFLEELSRAEAVVEDGDCVLPDFSGMSNEEIEAAALAAGLDLEPMQAAVPSCPVRFDCDSITNCGVGNLCSITDIGPCCQPSTGLQICCISGTIKVRRCPCECTGNPCALSCVNSTDVKWRCR